MRRHPQCLAQHPINAHPHDEAGLIRLNVDVGNAVARRIGDHAVDEADRGRIVGGIEQVFGGRDAVGEQVKLISHADRSERGGLAVHCIIVAEQAIERRRLKDRDVERPPQHAAHLDQRARIRALTQRHGVAGQGDAELAREGVGERDQVPLPLAGGVRGGHVRKDIAGVSDRPSPSPSRKREGSRRSQIPPGPDHLSRRLIVTVEFRCTGTLIRGSSIFPGTGALGIGAAAPI